MDKEGVRILLSTFKKQVQNYINRIDALPEGISFYDPQGDLVETYNRGLKSFKTEFHDLFDESINQMDIYINVKLIIFYWLRKKLKMLCKQESE